LVILLCAEPALLPAAVGGEVQAPEPAPTEARLIQGIQAYEHLEYEQGIQILQRLSAEPGLTPSRKKEALLFLALCQAALGRNDPSRKSFLEILEMDPDFRLDTNLYSPKILRLFDMARDDFQKSIRGRDSRPPSLLEREIHRPVPYRKPLTIGVRVLDDQRVQMVQVFLRKKGETSYGFYPMTEGDSGWYEAGIPAHVIDGEGIEYYILAADPAGNATMKGNAAFPLFLEVAPGPEATPWYKKWWIWAIIGAAAGAGAALGVTLSGGGDDSKSGNATLNIHLD